MQLSRTNIKMVLQSVRDLRQRTKEGIETGGLNGSQIGHTKGKKFVVKKVVEAKKVIREHSKDF